MIRYFCLTGTCDAACHVQVVRDDRQDEAVLGQEAQFPDEAEEQLHLRLLILKLTGGAHVNFVNAQILASNIHVKYENMQNVEVCQK